MSAETFPFAQSFPMYAWNRPLWQFASNNLSHSQVFGTRHRSGYYLSVVPTKLKNTTNSDNPLLIVQTVGAPTEAAERSVQISTVQGGGAEVKEEIPPQVEEEEELSEEESAVRVVQIDNKRKGETSESKGLDTDCSPRKKKHLFTERDY